jgi:hypothetical protein
VKKMKMMMSIQRVTLTVVTRRTWPSSGCTWADSLRLKRDRDKDRGRATTSSSNRGTDNKKHTDPEIIAVTIK